MPRVSLVRRRVNGDCNVDREEGVGNRYGNYASSCATDVLYTKDQSLNNNTVAQKLRGRAWRALLRTSQEPRCYGDWSYRSRGMQIG